MKRNAFSLIELLVVIGIVVILASLIAPAFQAIGGANSLTSGTEVVVSQLNLARQTALSESRQIELRFYKLPDSTGQDPQYRAMQLVNSSDGSALGNISRLPNEIIISESSQFSTLVSSLNGGAATTTTVQGQPGVEYRAIRFRPSGATTLDPLGAGGGSDRWFLTLASKRDLASSTNGTRPARNFVTVQIDPTTGRTQIFQP